MSRGGLFATTAHAKKLPGPTMHPRSLALLDLVEAGIADGRNLDHFQAVALLELFLAIDHQAALCRLDDLSPEHLVDRHPPTDQGFL